MRRFIVLTLMLGLLCAVCSTSAHAVADIGQVCWTFTGGLVDTLRLGVLFPDGPAGHPETTVDLFGGPVMWQATGLYVMYGGFGGGTSHPALGSWFLDLQMTNASAFFSGNTSCVAHVVLNKTTLNGTWNITCLGVSAPFVTNGTLLHDPECNGVFEPSLSSAVELRPAAGRAEQNKFGGTGD